ncbi:MAG: beta-galactosidase [Clostridiales bacterium]|jgi:beta-galactosidase GanA|nr:beta-galactosidase [Clostridiales bacterium]
MLNSIKPPYVGAAYYPEVWPLDNVDEDIRQMKEAGCNVMRIGEFAWSSMEPEEGVYTFDWLHTVVDKLYAAGIATVLGTPTPTPPKWLTDRYEDSKMMNSNGQRAIHGARRHTCPNSLNLRYLNKKIVAKMAGEFGSHPGVIGWQIDNEIYVYGDGCFCPICADKFRQWLKSKFTTIENLNTCWGMKRWSLDYNSFDQIIPPRHDMWNHPSLFAAWLEFQSDSYVEFINDQAGIIHKYSKAPVGTDMMPMLGFNYTNVHKDLDVAMFNHYDDKAGLHSRLPFWFNFLRNVKKDVPFWNTETQITWTGGVSASAGLRPEGFCYANSWAAFAYGGEMNLYWLWKCHPNGQELIHGSFVTPSGRFTHSVPEVQRLSAELEKSADFLNSTKVPQAEIALHFSDTAFRINKFAPIVEGFNYNASLQDEIHMPLVSQAHLHIDIIDTANELDGYKIIISPFLYCLQENNLPERLKAWIEAGGTWIAGPMTDIMDSQLVRFTDSPFSVLEDWTGVYCKYQIPFKDCGFKMNWETGEEFTGGICYDGFELNGNAKTLVTYTEGILKGLACITESRLGKGRIILLGSKPSSDDLIKLVKYVGAKPVFENMSANLQAVPRCDKITGRVSGCIIIEMEDKQGFVELDGTYENTVTGKKMSGTISMGNYEVLVLNKKPSLNP